MTQPRFDPDSSDSEMAIYCFCPIDLILYFTATETSQLIKKIWLLEIKLALPGFNRIRSNLALLDPATTRNNGRAINNTLSSYYQIVHE
jgi:hypothetical protein